MPKQKKVVLSDPVEEALRRRAARQWMIRILTVCGVALVVVMALFVVNPALQRSSARKRLAEADALARVGRAEEAVEAYDSITHKYRGLQVADRAAAERERLTPVVVEATALKRRADEAFKREEFEEALRLYGEVAERYPDTLRGRTARDEMPGTRKLACAQNTSRARAAAEERRWDRALEFYDRVLALDEEYPGARAGRAEAAGHVERYTTHIAQAREHESAGRWNEARRSYDAALGVLPHDTPAYDARLQCLRKVPPPQGMVLIPPGEFLVGADDGETDEAPARKLKTMGFCMDITEVTNAEYARFCAATSHRRPAHWPPEGPTPLQAGQPVVCVSWSDAAAYAAWAGKRLPTETEWERAARGPSGHIYPWGNALAGAEAIFARTARPVGRLPADRTEEGCMDMGGNVSEWTAESADAPRAGSRPIRGASWAGIEQDRFERVVPARLLEWEDPAKPSSAPAYEPTATVLVDTPKAWAVETRALAVTEFFFRGVSEGSAIIELRRWVPEVGKVIIISALVRPGAAIAGERSMPGGDGKPVRVKFDTQCRLVRIVEDEIPQRQRIVYTDATGNELEMERVTRVPPPPTVEPRTDSRQEPNFDVISARSLSDVARSANRWAAPLDARFINVGFRCVKDFD